MTTSSGRLALGLVALLVAAHPLQSAEPAGNLSKLAGTWTWTWKDPAGQTHRHFLDVEGVASKLAARERFDELPAVRVADLKLVDQKVRFSVVRDAKRADYNGVVADAETINGTVTVTIEGQAKEYVWKATRERPSK